MSFIVKAATGNAVVSRQKGHQPSVMSSRFPDVEFQSAWRELDKPQLEGGWEHFVEAMGVTIFRLFDKGSQLYEYKVFGVLATSTQLCADVYMDLAYRKHWDKYVKELYEKDFSGQSAIYWEVKYPFPLSNRDYVYVRERRDLDVDGRKISVILARSAPEVPCPEVSGVLRVKDYKQSVAMESDGGSGTKIFLNYFDNPGGSIPSWLVNWAAGTGVPGFLTEMQKACSNYSSYCEKK